MKVRNGYTVPFEPSERLKRVKEYNDNLAISGRRNLYTADDMQLLYHWTDKANGCVPKSGEWTAPKETSISLGDHSCAVDIGKGFPAYDRVPSHVEGYEATPESWGRDYKFLLDNSPAEIHPDEAIVGEYHWEMNEIRQYYFGDEVHALGRKVRALGAGGTSHGHTCPDLSIGLSEGWGGILERIEKNLAMYTRLEHPYKAQYLRGLKMVCEGIIGYINSHAERARVLAAQESDPAQRELYASVARDCAQIAQSAPQTFRQAVQWIQFAIMTDRMVGHGNGYGRLDAYLDPFFRRDTEAGTLTREDAREYLAEMFLKVRGQHFSLGGRNRDGSDATNDTTRLILETYDMMDGYNNLFLLWHKDMDSDVLDYACDVLARHGASVPTLCNYDLLLDSELRSGVDPEYAWTVSVTGCQWYCIPGREYCDQDVNALVLLDPMWRAIDAGIENGVEDFETLFGLFCTEFDRTAQALREFKDLQYEALDKVWPEMATSLNCYGPVERGIDITGKRGVDVQFTSTNILGIPNVADSLYAIKRLVFDKKEYTLEQVRRATQEDWKDNEVMRQRFLSEDKWGNDLDEVDALCVEITDMIAGVLDRTYNNRGQQYRASLFQFQGHTATGILPATPDGRHAHEPLAHGCNPTAGRNTRGLLATANSLAKIKNHKFQGGTLQIELQPKFFDGREDTGQFIRRFAEAFFGKNTFQINLNIIDLEKLRDAIDHPDNPEYRNIIIKVTGYTTRFVNMDKSFRIEFCGRNNYEAM